MYDSNNSAMTNERSSPKLSPSTHRGNNKQSMSADKNKNQSQQDQRQRLDSTDSIGIMQMCHDDAVTAMKMLNSVGDNNDVTMIEEHEDNNVVNGAETGVDDNSAIIVVPEPFSSEGLKVQIDVVEYWCDMLLHSDSDAPVATAAAEESETEDAGYGHGKKRRKKHKRDETITLESSMSSLRKTIGRARELNRSLQLLPGSKGYGRLFNRLQISSLVGEVCISSPLFAEQEQDFSKLLVDEENEPLCDWSTERWIQIREKIILLKSRLLRRDANTLVMLTSYSHINETTDDQQLLSQKDDTLDERLGQHSMFTDEYRSLLKLLDVHIIISKFRNSLKTLWKDASKKENKINSGRQVRNSKSYPVLLKQLEFIIDEYEGTLTNLLLNSGNAEKNTLKTPSPPKFRPSTTSITHPTVATAVAAATAACNSPTTSQVKGRGDKKGIATLIEKNNIGKTPATVHFTDDSTVTAASNSDDDEERQLFTTLTSFLLKDMYGTHKSNDSLIKLPQKLYGDINNVMMMGTSNSKGTERHTYWFLQHKLRTLLRKWCSRVLERPAFIKLGYVPTTNEQHDDDDDDGDNVDKCSVSSWGNDGDHGRHDEMKDRDELIQETAEKEEQARAVAKIIQVDERQVSLEESEPIQVIDALKSDVAGVPTAKPPSIEETIEEETISTVLKSTSPSASSEEKKKGDPSTHMQIDKETGRHEEEEEEEKFYESRDKLGDEEEEEESQQLYTQQLYPDPQAHTQEEEESQDDSGSQQQQFYTQPAPPIDTNTRDETPTTTTDQKKETSATTSSRQQQQRSIDLDKTVKKSIDGRSIRVEANEQRKKTTPKSPARALDNEFKTVATAVPAAAAAAAIADKQRTPISSPRKRERNGSSSREQHSSTTKKPRKIRERVVSSEDDDPLQLKKEQENNDATIAVAQQKRFPFQTDGIGRRHFNKVEEWPSSSSSDEDEGEIPSSSSKRRKKRRTNTPKQQHETKRFKVGDGSGSRQRQESVKSNSGSSVGFLSSSDDDEEDNKFNVKQRQKQQSTRRRFTDKEKTAIKQGVARHGKGQWAVIKREYADILQTRSNVNIKDCYRSMLNRGEVRENDNGEIILQEQEEGDASISNDNNSTSHRRDDEEENNMKQQDGKNQQQQQDLNEKEDGNEQVDNGNQDHEIQQQQQQDNAATAAATATSRDTRNVQQQQEDDNDDETEKEEPEYCDI